jgi:hypothetical protein
MIEKSSQVVLWIPYTELEFTKLLESFFRSFFDRGTFNNDFLKWLFSSYGTINLKMIVRLSQAALRISSPGLLVKCRL